MSEFRYSCCKPYWSKTYGINQKSSLLDFLPTLLYLPYFSMFGASLPHDKTHVILEGIAPLEIKLLLSHCITNGLFTLEVFNHWALSFNFGDSETDKPVPILTHALQLNNTISSSASQMLLLLQTLPFLFGDKVSEHSKHSMALFSPVEKDCWYSS